MRSVEALVFMAEEDCVLGLGGVFTALSAGVPFIYPAPWDSELAFTVWGAPDGSSIPAAHRLRIGNGSLEFATLPAVDWGSAAEIMVSPIGLPKAAPKTPLLLSEAKWFAGERRAKAELYSDNGVRLAISPEGGEPYSYPLGEGCEGSLRTVDFGFARLLSVRLKAGKGERLLLIDQKQEKVFEAAGDEAFLDEGVPTVIESLGTVRGHERRTRWEYRGGGFVPEGSETGFFTRAERAPESLSERAASAAEEARLGLPSRGEFISEELQGMLGENGLADFLGDFETVSAYPLEEGAGLATIGLFGKREGNIARPKKLLFTFREGLIDDIEEL